MVSNKSQLKSNLVIPPIYDCRTKVIYAGPNQKYRDLKKLLHQNKKVCFTKTFGTVLSFYSWLKKKTFYRYRPKNYQSGIIFRQKFRDLASNILVKVIDGRVNLRGAPDNPWLTDFYPHKSCFFISFPDLLGMNGSWQWFSKGIQFPGLSQKLHPFYGTYFPTRFEHLELFDKWLNENKNQFNNAIDIGTGCGVLVFYMLKHKITNISATDINPNAIHSISEDLKKHKCSENVKVKKGSLFADFNNNYDLVVFNPPWIPGSPKTIIDKGIYYEEGIWNAFFCEAANKMVKGSKMILLFSNIAMIRGISSSHPLKEQLKSSNKFKLIDVLTKPVNNRQKKYFINSDAEIDKTNREIVELWDIEFSG